MYQIFPAKTFKKSYRRYKRSGKFSKSADEKLQRAVLFLATGKKLPQEFSDHALSGALQDYRECHIKGDVLLVYRRDVKKRTIDLVAIGSHAELFE